DRLDRNGDVRPRARAAISASCRRSRAVRPAMIHVESPGFGSTVQDQGRPAHVRAGVPVSGPADPFAFRAAQALVGNTEADAAIEAVGLPFAFRSDSSRVVAVTGRDLRIQVRDRVPAWTAVFVRAGDLVRID